ncbi:MAG: hypothetical protein K8F62_15120 [Pseudorhodoplanes sp.]|nr:hypothetical protein [Pseudorhodoplanes sp.]
MAARPHRRESHCNAGIHDPPLLVRFALSERRRSRLLQCLLRIIDGRIAAAMVDFRPITKCRARSRHIRRWLFTRIAAIRSAHKLWPLRIGGRDFNWGRQHRDADDTHTHKCQRGSEIAGDDQKKMHEFGCRD